MNSRSFRLKIVVCLTIAVAVTFIAVAAKAIVPAMIAGASADNSNKAENPPVQTPVISLDPDLSYETSFGSPADDQTVFAATINGHIFLLCNYGEIAVITKFDDDLTVLSSTTYDGKFSYADVCADGLVAAVNDRIITIDTELETVNQTPVYENQKIIALTSYSDGVSAIYLSKGESNYSLAFRFFKNGVLTTERYCISAYELSVVKQYRIGDLFIVFYQYGSAYSSGGGYAKFSLSGKTAGCVNIERSDNYSLLDVIPYGDSYALLTSCIDGVNIMELDENLNRYKTYDIIDSAALSGRLSFDGKNYYAFVGGANKGIMADFGERFGNFELIGTYSAATEITCEINVGGSLTHLCKCTNGFFITNTSGLFTKRIDNRLSAKFLLTGTFGAVVAGDGNLSNTTLKSIGGNDIYLAKLN